ncbi:uncharacterized protein LOC129755346 [Uranotaenia lowii]|uniref:uncharacterized protein LOC129755346 n=1 Tax=Uranotaenia lowii TaxID=190385 RepID=UPI0024791A80|nr:uncharacterized protein LOC129755346 [Uranotaenia lowii]
MWLKVLIGCCLIGALAADKNATEELQTTKGKRQTDHETRTLPQHASNSANRRQHSSGPPAGYFQDSDAAAQYFAQQAAGGQLVFRPQQLKAASQEQVQELPPEYLSLIQQLAEHQKHGGAPSAGGSKASKHQQQQQHQQQLAYEVASSQSEQFYHQPQPQAQRHHHAQQLQHQQQQQQQQHHHQQDNQIQYITEEEYQQILKQAQVHNQQQAAAQPQYARPSGKQESHKYRPSVQLLETAPDHGHSFSHPEADQFRIQYKSIQPTGSVTPVPKPISSFQFEKELAKLVESNRPLAYHQSNNAHRQPERGAHETPRYVASSHGHEFAYTHPGAQEHVPKQSIKAQYIAPFAQPHAGPKVNAAHLQVGPQKFSESPAQKYQFIVPEAPSKAQHPQQYFAEVSQKYAAQSGEKHQAGAPSPKIQYYVPKEKNLQIYYPHHIQEKQQQIEQHSPQHPMKIVEAPQLQNEKPHKQAQVHRQKAQYIAREKQAEQSQQSYHKSNESDGPSRSAIFVSQQTGVAPTQAAQTQTTTEKQQTQHQTQHHKIPPKIDRPLTQEEFQALVDAGYSVVPVPVPVPVPVSQYHAQQGASRSGAPAVGTARHGPIAQASRYHQHQLAEAETNPRGQVISYIRPVHIDPFSAGIRGPNKAAP